MSLPHVPGSETELEPEAVQQLQLQGFPRRKHLGVRVEAPGETLQEVSRSSHTFRIF